jgi:hypothetical protein
MGVMVQVSWDAAIDSDPDRSPEAAPATVIALALHHRKGVSLAPMPGSASESRIVSDRRTSESA